MLRLILGSLAGAFLLFGPALAQQPVAPCVTLSGQPSPSCAPVTAANPLPIRDSPVTIATGQVSVATTAGGTLIAAARAGRKSLTVIQEGTTLVRLGASGVTAATGVPLPGTAYAAFTIDGGAAVYGIVASGTQTVSYVESY